MSLKDALSAATAERYPCRIGQLMAVLGREDAAALHEAFVSGTPMAHIQRALRSEGHIVDYKGITRHSRNECTCREA